jgi:tellurite resistance protein
VVAPLGRFYTLSGREPQRGENAVSFQRRIPPNLFGVAFGLAGLAQVWQAAERVIGAPRAVANALFIVAAVAWVLITVAYFGQGWRRVLGDLRDTVFAPFVSLAFVIPILFGAALYPYAATGGRVIVAVCLAGTVLVGGWLTGQWMAGDLDPVRLHPGYFLPTVAGGFIGSAAAAHVGFRSAGVAAFGIGLVCWLMLGSILLNRLFLRGSLPIPLVPSLAIEAAPPAVAGIAYLALSGPRIGTDIFGGYTVLMVLVQVRLLPLYLRLRFDSSFWLFGFAYASVASYALYWLDLSRPAGYRGYAAVVLVLITGFIGVIGVRSLLLAAKGEYLPASADAPDAPSRQPSAPAPRHSPDAGSPSLVRGLDRGGPPG